MQANIDYSSEKTYVLPYYFYLLIMFIIIMIVVYMVRYCTMTEGPAKILQTIV